MITSSGAPSACATPTATATPPRGMAKTTGGLAAGSGVMRGTGGGTPSFGIIGFRLPEDFPQRGTKQQPRLGAVPEGGRTGQPAARRARGLAITGAYTRHEAQ